MTSSKPSGWEDVMVLRPEQKPSVGRIVHYVSHGTPVREDGSQAYKSKCRAAIVTDVYRDGEMIAIVVFNPEGMFFNTTVNHDEENHDGGTWHWPERV